MLYRQKEVAPAADHDNIDMIMSGAVTYEEGLQRPEGSESELRPGVLRFMDIWVTVQHVLQDPVRETMKV